MCNSFTDRFLFQAGGRTFGALLEQFTPGQFTSLLGKKINIFVGSGYGFGEHSYDHYIGG